MGVFSYPSSGHNTRIPFHGGDPIHVNIGGTSHIPSYAPFSTKPIPSNSFLITHTPRDPHSPLGWSASSSHVVPLTTGTIVLGVYVPPYVSGGQPVYQSYNYGYIEPHYQGVPIYNILMYPFIDHA